MALKRYRRHRRPGPDAKVNPIYDTLGIMHSMQRIAGAQGCSIVPEEGCTQPRTDLVTKQIYVEPLDPYWSELRIAKWRGEVCHEIGHHSERCKDMLPYMTENGIQFDSVRGRLSNILEDDRNEKFQLGNWPGRDSDLSWTQAFYCTRGAESLKGCDVSTLTPDMLLTTKVLAWMYTCRARWQRDLDFPSIAFEKALGLDITGYSKHIEELDAMRTAQDVFTLVDKLIDESPDHDLEEEIEKSKAECDKEGDESEEAEGEGEAGEGEGDGKPSDEEGEGKGSAKLSYKDLMGHVHSDDKDGIGNGYVKIEYDHEPKGDYIPSENMVVMKARLKGQPNLGYTDRTTRMWKHGRSMAGTARRLFQSRMQSSVIHNQKRGRLDKRDFYRIPTGSVDVFKQKVDAIDPKGTALFILTDASGSMTGHKFEMTGAAVALLNEAVNPLGVPTYIAAFTERGSTGPQHYIIKDFDERRNSEDIITDYSRLCRSLKQNADGESIMWASKILMARPEPRKILLVLSDGQPAADNWGDCWTYTKDVIAHVGKHMECYGVGIMDTAVEHLYPEYTLIDDVDKLEAGLLDIIKKKVFT